MDEKKSRILTGHRPTGPRHIGHLAGTLETWAGLQDSYECFFLIADLHVLTTDFEHPHRVKENILEVLADWLACGIDPDRSTIILQSSIGEHAQLSLLLSMLSTVARLARVPTYKEQVHELKLRPSLGLLSYPVLQAADILIYKARAVPVGDDQLPHLELAREAARRFNQIYGETFPEPEPILSSQPRLPGIDNRTMHTSYGNAIFLKDTPEATYRKVMSMYTDPHRIHADQPGTVEGNPVFDYHDVFNKDQEEVDEFKRLYRLGKIGDVQVKERLAQRINEHLAPIREQRADIITRPGDLRDILFAGTERARPLACAVYEEAKYKMGLNFLKSK
jgi:tryptophanyl-tRNA synthetase